MKFLKIFLLVLMVFLAYSCQSPGLVDLPPSFISIVEGPAEGAMLKNDHVYFKWKGSSNDYKFKYELQILDEDNVVKSYDTTTAYGDITEQFFSNLDEGKYIFTVWGKSGSLEQKITRHFTINSITTPTLLFFKKDNNLKVNDSFYLLIKNENIDSLLAFRVVITFDPQIVQFVSVEKTQFVSHKNFDELVLPDSLLMNSTTPFSQRINKFGKIEIYTAFLSRNQNQMSIKGTGSLLKLNFRAVARGESFVEFTKVELVNENYKVLNAVNYGQAHILVQ